MRVLFVYPNLYTQMGFNHGLATLSAVLREAGHETRLVNLNETLPPVPTPDEVWATIRAWEPGLVGFSCLSQQYPKALELARWLRARAEREGVRLPPLVVGGIHPTMMPAEVMADGVWDHVGVGECEDALLELVRRIEAGERPTDVANFLSWKGGVRPELPSPVASEHWVHNPVGEFPDFAALPFPDYELFDTQRILDQKQGWFGVRALRARGRRDPGAGPRELGGLQAAYPRDRRRALAGGDARRGAALRHPLQRVHGRPLRLLPGGGDGHRVGHGRRSSGSSAARARPGPGAPTRGDRPASSPPRR